ncbi:MAG: tRNA pseudouridine(55) synthase TruB [Actinobacteria bacterium]|uniref:tRNA pseudouridine(55) synthase n=1 Tax=freshwater metagenome TaxID=449393 RepID=A0A6J6CG90_9ZZZZ|nr:tRNA pseudouridine(55) synthase TruB [Actinomycetota bacterium]
MLSGIVLVDKSPGMTSHDVVAKLRKQLSEKKIGHAGTLDPFATGLLIMGVGSGTKLLHHLFGLDKQYQATIRLGQSTSTDDLEGEVISESSAKGLSLDLINQEIRNLTGSISQTPSTFSAIRIEGKRAYDLARDGKEFSIPSREVKVYHFQPTSNLRQIDKFIELDVIVDCSSGTYIRALARDLGTALGVGGHLTALRRTRIGEFSLEDAVAVHEVDSLRSLPEAAKKVFQSVELTQGQAQDIIHGKRIALVAEETVAATYQGNLLAILEPIGNSYRSTTVFPEAFHV